MTQTKKEIQINFDINESGKPTIEEWILIFTFPITLAITLNFPYAFFLSICILLISMLCHNFLIDKKGRDKLIDVGIKMWFATLVFFIIDSLSTYYAVHYKKIAYEKNIFPQFLWNNFGFIGGELIRWSLVGLVFGFAYYKLVYGKPKESLIALLFIIFVFIIWLYVVIGNLYQLIDFFC